MLRFKSHDDLVRWNGGEGPPHVRQWISMFNAISWQVAERAAVITSWKRNDGTFHQDLEAVDFRRLSAANELDRQPYTEEDCKAIEKAAIFQGLPLVVVHARRPSEHWHCGPVHLIE